MKVLSLLYTGLIFCLCAPMANAADSIPQVIELKSSDLKPKKGKNSSGKSKDSKKDKDSKKNKTNVVPIAGPAGRDFASSYGLVNFSSDNAPIAVGSQLMFDLETSTQGGREVIFDQSIVHFTKPGHYLVSFHIPYYTILKSLPFSVGSVLGVPAPEVTFTLEGSALESPVRFVGTKGSLEDQSEGLYRQYGAVTGAIVVEVTRAPQSLSIVAGGTDAIVLSNAYLYVLKQD